MNNGNELFARPAIPIRQLDQSAAAAELRLSVEDLQGTLAKLDEAQIVTQETLQFEFSI